MYIFSLPVSSRKASSPGMVITGALDGCNVQCKQQVNLKGCQSEDSRDRQEGTAGRTGARLAHGGGRLGSGRENNGGGRKDARGRKSGKETRERHNGAN